VCCSFSLFSLFFLFSFYFTYRIYRTCVGGFVIECIHTIVKHIAPCITFTSSLCPVLFQMHFFYTCDLPYYWNNHISSRSVPIFFWYLFFLYSYLFTVYFFYFWNINLLLEKY